MYLMLCYYCSKLAIETPKAGYLIFLFPANIYLLEVNERNARKRCEKCSKLTTKTAEDVLLFLLLTLNIFYTFVFLLLNLNK